MRRSILQALEHRLPKFQGRFLDVGAGNQPYRSVIESDHTKVTEYVPLDLHDNQHYRDAEYTWNGETMPFADGSFDCAMATEVLEHCPDPEVVLKEVARVLRPDGLFFLTVPFLWPLHDCPHDEYRYTPWALGRHLRNAGFADIDIRPTGGWDASLAQMLGLWVRRRAMAPWRRAIMSRALLPLVWWLGRTDRIPDTIGEGQMAIGFEALARRRANSDESLSGKIVDE